MVSRFLAGKRAIEALSRAKVKQRWEMASESPPLPIFSSNRFFGAKYFSHLCSRHDPKPRS